jgi:predicted molibdopterin-dependent oxidoreductase YjgC
MVRIHVDGRALDVEPGTSLLAALWNAGVLALRQSASGQARGALCGMGTCFECRVAVDGVHHRRACTQTVREGMEVSTVG